MAPTTPHRPGASAGLRALPNIISSSRVVLAAGFVASHDPDVRLGLVGVAAATDFLDGWIARRARVTSRWGALIDPIADRVFALVAVSTLLFSGALSTFGVGFLVARVVSWLKPVEFKARWSGKLVTVLQFVGLVAALRFPQWLTACLWLVGAASLYSIVDYTYALWRARAR
jgi:cardiolipin synthase (CMP-forming)